MRATPRTPRPVARTAALLAASALLLGACGDGTATPTPRPAGGNGAGVTDAGRTSPRTADAAPICIANDGEPTALVGVEVDPQSGGPKLHETVNVEDGGDGGQDGGMDGGGTPGVPGTAAAWAAGRWNAPGRRIVVPAGGESSSSPAASIMLLDLAARSGDSSVELTLEFEESGEQW